MLTDSSDVTLKDISKERHIEYAPFSGLFAEYYPLDSIAKLLALPLLEIVVMSIPGNAELAENRGIFVDEKEADRVHVERRASVGIRDLGHGRLTTSNGLFMDFTGPSSFRWNLEELVEEIPVNIWHPNVDLAPEDTQRKYAESPDIGIEVVIEEGIHRRHRVHG